MWILPKNYPLSSHFVQDMVELKEDLTLPGLNIESSLMWRSKHSKDPNSPWYGAKLKDAVEAAEAKWPTPAARDYKGTNAYDKTIEKIADGKREHGATSQRSDGAGSKVEMANANSEGLQGSEWVRETDAEGQPIGHPAKCSEELAYSRCSASGEGEQQTELWAGGSGESSRCTRDYSTERSYAEGQAWPAGAGPEQYEWEEPRTIWKAESKLGGAVDGSAYRVDRLRLLGNGVVPQTAAKAYITLSERLK